MEIPRIKLIVSVCPNKAADAKPVKIVATVEEYFFKIVSLVLHCLLSRTWWLLNVREEYQSFQDL